MRRDLNYKSNKPLLYIIATPIGNLDEFTERAKKIIGETDFVACEDTRVTGKLLSFFGLQKQLISCHEHNEKQASENIIELLKSGKSVAYMSDAGYPSVSDPGQKLISEALENEINVSVISGSNAMLNALVGSGLESDHFYFHGFLDARAKAREEELRNLYKKVETLIFYESPHRIEATIKALFNVFGARKACIARELTKVHEEYIRGNLEDFFTLDFNSLKGEMVIIVEGNQEKEFAHLSDGELKTMVDNFTKVGLSTKDAIKKVSELTNINKNQIYKIYHN